MQSTKSEKLVLGAVKQRDASRKQGILQRLFAVWFDAFVYNQIWEDPRVDLLALKLDARSRILTISSGGCNALSYLIESPESVTAVDLNRNHIYLLNLKLAALKTLPDHEAFFKFFGLGLHADNIGNYTKFIAPSLDDHSRGFWESNSLIGSFFSSKRIDYFSRDGLYEHSRNGYFLKCFHRLARLFRCKPEELLAATTRDEQEQLYRKNIAPFFDSFVIRTIGNLPVTMFGLGIPPQQYDELKKELVAGGTLIDVYRERVYRLAVEYPIIDNYFAWQAFGRRYDTENRKAIPEYLKELNFDVLRSNADRLRTRVGSITDEIKIRPKDTFNRFVFLDAQDWMDPETLTDLWSAIAEKGEPGSRIIFRTAGASSPIEKNLPAELRGKFDYQKEISEKLFRQDRASIYGGFHLYILGS